MATADYPDYDALNLVLAAIGSPAQSGGKSLLDVINELSAVISQIQVGSPIITNPVLLANSGFGATITSLGLLSYGPFATTGTAYAISFQPWYSSTATTPDMTISVIITDSANNIVDEVVWDCPASHGGGNAGYVLNGPIFGTQIEVVVQNNGNISGHIIMTLTATNLPIYKHSLLPTAFSTVDGFTTPPNFQPGNLILIQSSPTVGASSNVTYLLPPSSGSASLSFRAHNNPSNMLFQLFAYNAGNSFLGAAGTPLWSGSTTTNQAVTANIPLPRCGTIVKATNNGTSGDITDIAVVPVPT